MTDANEHDEEIDVGPYCVSCGEDTTGQTKRTEATRTQIAVRGEEGNPEVASILVKGWRCESCQPFEAELIEAAYQALIKRRHDPSRVKKMLREMGEEDIWSRWLGPMLDSIELSLGLEV